MNLVLVDLAVLQLPDHRRGAERDLVHPVLAPHHDRMLRAQALHDAHLDADQVGMEHPHQDVRRARRVGQRPEDVEDGAHAEFAAHRRDVLHRRVVVGREHEADAGRAHAIGHLLRVQHDVGAQRLEHVGGARLRRHAAVAVLGHRGARRRRDEGRRGRDVERVRSVAPGADDVDEVRTAVDLDLVGELAHDLRRGADLADRLLLHAQPHQDGRHHRRRHLAAHDLAHDLQHLVVEDLAVLDASGQRFLRGDRHVSSPGNCAAARGRAR